MTIDSGQNFMTEKEKLIDPSVLGHEVRDNELDGLRAILALMVAVCHSIVWLNVSGNKILFTYPVWNSLNSFSEYVVRSTLYMSVGVGTIYSFFIMSGYILSQKMTSIYNHHNLLDNKLNKGAIMRMYRYLISQRIMRIYPIHILIISLTFFSLLVFHRSNSSIASDFYNLFYAAAPMSEDYVKNILFLSVNLNPVGWTLFHELWPFVFAMPIFFMITMSSKFKYDLLNIVALFLLGQSMQYIPITPQDANMGECRI